MSFKNLSAQTSGASPVEDENRKLKSYMALHSSGNGRFPSVKTVSLYRNGVIKQVRKGWCYFLRWNRGLSSNPTKTLDFKRFKERDFEGIISNSREVVKYLFPVPRLGQWEQTLKYQQPISTVSFARFDSSGKARQIYVLCK